MPDALRAENVVESTIAFAGADGIVNDKPLPFFLESYAEAYRRELDHFIAEVTDGTAPLVGGDDGVRAWRWPTPRWNRSGPATP
jgi:myo-inositol 2-dehydrogenase/D-chiro-inositol 1-dehydrogenase